MDVNNLQKITQLRTIVTIEWMDGMIMLHKQCTIIKYGDTHYLKPYKKNHHKYDNELYFQNNLVNTEKILGTLLQSCHII